MTTFPMADNGRRMGRPPLKAETETVKTTIRLTADIAERITKVAGPNRMSSFIREAVLSELERREQDQP